MLMVLEVSELGVCGVSSSRKLPGGSWIICQFWVPKGRVSSCKQRKPPQWSTDDNEIKGSDLPLEGKIPKVVCKHSELQRHKSWRGYKTCLVPRQLHTFINLWIMPACWQYCFWLASRAGVLGLPGALWTGTTQLRQVVYGSLERTQENQELLGVTKSTTCLSPIPYTALFFFFLTT